MRPSSRFLTLGVRGTSKSSPSASPRTSAFACSASLPSLGTPSEWRRGITSGCDTLVGPRGPPRLAADARPRPGRASPGGRTAIVMPAMFAMGDKVIGNPTLATFAAFGSFAMLLLVDFSGPIRDRVLAQARSWSTCAVLVCLGTLASRWTWWPRWRWRSSVSRSCSPGWSARCWRAPPPRCCSPSSCPCRCRDRSPRSPTACRLGTGGGGVSILAIALLWPAPARDPFAGRGDRRLPGAGRAAARRGRVGDRRRGGIGR